jgi:hypothetical protein
MKAITSPIAFLLVILELKNNAPIITTKSGVMALKTPVRELLSCVCALANKNAGIKLPTKPTIMRFLTCRLFRPFNLGNESGNKTIPANTILKAPTSPGEYTSRPLFIKIKELPQTKAKMIRKPHALRALSDCMSLSI